MGRVVWFVAGAGLGVYASVKARRLAYRASPSGLADQAAALRLGAQALLDDVLTAARAREDELRGQSPASPPRAEVVELTPHTTWKDGT